MSFLDSFASVIGGQASTPSPGVAYAVGQPSGPGDMYTNPTAVPTAAGNRAVSATHLSDGRLISSLRAGEGYTDTNGRWWNVTYNGPTALAPPISSGPNIGGILSSVVGAATSVFSGNVAGVASNIGRFISSF